MTMAATDTPTRVHCATCTCSPESSLKECIASKRIGHETFTCYGSLGHPGPHWCIRQVPACPRCGGYDEHRTDCPNTDMTTPDSERFEWDAAFDG